MRNYFKDIVTLFTSSHQDEEVKSKFHAWLINEEYSDEKEAALYECWLHTNEEGTEDMEKVLSDIYQKAGIYSEPVKLHPARIHSLQWLQPIKYAAAVAVLVVSVYTTHYLTKQEYTQIATIEKYVLPGEMQFVELPDGSKVQINSGTLLLYPEKFLGETRTVYLVGEANFKVKKNPQQPFIVRSGMMAVRALGTEFNVNSYSENEEIIATLLEGKIKVDCGQDGKSYLLTPGQQITYNKKVGTSFLTEVDMENVTAWQRGELVFRSMTLEDIAVVLHRKFGITFKYKQRRFNADKYNFRFSNQASFDEVMKIIQATVGGFEYRIEDKVCYID